MLVIKGIRLYVDKSLVTVVQRVTLYFLVFRRLVTPAMMHFN